MFLFDILEVTLLLLISGIYIIQCPFNKVEESFNTQAVHDIINIFPNKLPYQDINLVRATNSTNYDSSASGLEFTRRQDLPWDHVLFPGVVTRTFVGAVIVGIPMKLVKYLIFHAFNSHKNSTDLTSQFILQMSSRFALSGFVIFSLSILTRALQKRYGISYRMCFLLTTITQFHYLFYASRFLPNTYAAILVNLALASWVDRRNSKAVVYIAFCVIIFRFDTSLFFGWLIINGAFIRGQLPISRVLKVGIPAGILAIFISLLVDSIFWSRIVWPELEGLYFNLWLNKSSEWGTQPYFWYIYSCVPRMLLFSSPFLLMADHKINRDYLTPTLAYVLTYSILPHKELRFILFVNPLLNICVASGLLNVYSLLVKLVSYANLRKSIAKLIFISIICAVCVLNLTASYHLLRISSLNYPGGQAAITVGSSRELETDGINSSVYVDNLAAQTGFSRFVQVDKTFYAKTPELDRSTFINTYNLIHLVVEPWKLLKIMETYCDSLNMVGLEQWRTRRNELKCTIPNQVPMFCSVVNSIYALESVNLKELLKFSKFENYIQTYPALDVVRCSIRSKFNPFL